MFAFVFVFLLNQNSREAGYFPKKEVGTLFFGKIPKYC